MLKKITALSLVLVMVFSAFAIPASADYTTGEKIENSLNRFLDKVVDVLVGGIAMLIFDPGWEWERNYETEETFLEGMDANQFKAATDADATWNVGYSSASLQTGKELIDEHYVGGSLSVTKKLATSIADDQRVRTVAMSTTGKKEDIVIFASLDAYGLANSDVRIIRERFMKYAKDNNLDVESINVFTLHQHSCIDTFGMNGDIISALFTSSVKNLFGVKLNGGKNPEFMENLYTQVVNTMIDAVSKMTEGDLYYGTVDISEYIREKREPEVFDPNINRLRFVPADTAKREIWLVNLGLHCVGYGAGPTDVTGDYPYYMEKYINENANADFIMIQGAELAISVQGDSITPDPADVEKTNNDYAHIMALGKRLGELTCSINNEIPVGAKLSIAHKEVLVDVDNSILVLAAKGGLLSNKVYKSGLANYRILSEVGYAEFGDELAISLIPGELAPEIAWGGAETAETSWDGANWEYDTFESMSNGRKLLVFGLSNDQIGYILTDNSWHSYFTENEEIVSAGKTTGSTIWTAYNELVKSVKK